MSNARVEETSTPSRRSLFGPARFLAPAVLLLILWQGHEIFLLLFAGVLLALFLSRLTDLAERYTPLPRNAAFVTVLALLAALLAGAVWLAAPSVSGQLDELTERLPQAVGRLTAWAQNHRWSRRLLEQAPDPQRLLASQPQMIAKATTLLSSTAGLIGAVLLVLAIGLYLAAQLDLYRRGFLHLIPPHRRPQAREVLADTVATLQQWLNAQLVSMSVVGVLTTLGLWWLGIPLALTLGLLAALMEFIPNFGPILAALPGILLALLQSPSQALWVAVLYIVVQTLESYVITPLAQRRITSLPPVLVISFQLLNGVLFGVLGLALATPLLAMGMVLVKRLYVEDRLGDTLDAETA
jgi:predicted PurR-regulated permease PerM